MKENVLLRSTKDVKQVLYFIIGFNLMLDKQISFNDNFTRLKVLFFMAMRSLPV